ncbi:MAG: thiol:disulfide interchange protein DsbA/DsbL [Hylemonella sp.]|uniref:thiol:disulfide interchange protein DsbA/DsbL n=1 Tax=Hylemonella sp. TaxID=2066020 RepID=UPI0022BF8715|nr:thiol:disulfide interchange protein DsbA/DsbL [Hylemonella sp.]MCZ8253009.1 thiol:disulfide interchange protein DsbA/DsbL [Hylemonella sp.]
MKRREFTLALAGATALPVLAQQRFEAGKDYLPLDKPAPIETPAGKIEVVEFFWYNCPHCNAFEPALEAWIKRAPKDVVVKRVPVAFSSTFQGQQRLYYTLEAMGLVDRLHGKVFQAIHVERKRLESPEVIAEWAAAQGVDKTKFLEQFNSFSVASKATRASQLTAAYKVEGVPALGVAGRFYTDATLTRNMDRSLQVVEYLVGEVRKGR